MSHGGQTKAGTDSNVPLPVKRILVPVDFSECSIFALRYAANLARQADASILLVYVATSLIAPPEMEFVQLDTKKFREEVEKHATAKLTSLARSTVPGTVRVTPIVRHGSAWERICKVAKERRADLIVVGSHGYTGFKHLILGSTAEKVVRSAGCPVLVVRDRERK